MQPALDDLQRLRGSRAFHSIDEPILAIDPARPPALQSSLQWLRLPSALERVPTAFLDQLVEALQRLGIVADPVLVVLPAFVREDDPPGFASSRSLPLPASICSIERRRRAALAGEVRRRIVSSMAFHSEREAITITMPSVG